MKTGWVVREGSSRTTHPFNKEIGEVCILPRKRTRNTRPATYHEHPCIP